MNALLLPGLLLLSLVLALLIWRARRDRVVSCSLQETLMPPDRHREFDALQTLLQGEARLFTHVRLKDVLQPGKGVGKGKWQKQLQALGDKQFDYLLCHPEDLSLLCALERRAPGQGKRRPGRDRLLMALCERASLPLLVLEGGEQGDLEELKERVLALLVEEEDSSLETLSAPGGERREPTFNPDALVSVELEASPRAGAREERSAPRAAGRVRNKRHERTEQEANPHAPALRPVSATPPAPHDEAPLTTFSALPGEEEEAEEHMLEPSACPRCTAPLQEREARKGPYAGKQFLTCTRFPECRYASLKQTLGQ